MMKKSVTNISLALALAAALAMPGALRAQALQSGAKVSDTGIERVRDSVVISMDICLDSMQVHSNRSVVMQPLLESENGKAWLPALEVMGRRRHIYYQRNAQATYADNPMKVIRKRNGEPQTMRYRTSLPYAPWMDGADLLMTEDLCGCGQVEEGPGQPLGKAHVDFVPQLAYVSPEAVVSKEDSLKGSSYLDFPVNKTTIYPDYRRNPQELARIRASIDTVRHDRDLTITRISLKGYASPEGTWRLNTRLAEGRTEALKHYVMEEYGYGDTLFVTDSQPENWQGLRAYVLQSGLPDKDAILAIIDSDEAPDPKEARLKREHPQSYRHLLEVCYPGLRRTDYVISYHIRGFNVDEARQVIRTQPQKLSLQEMFAVAQTYEPGSAEFNQVFDVAVRLFPDDPVANLNAANALLQSGHPDQAAPYLDKAGDSPQAQNARAVALLLQSRYDEALPLLRQARDAGLEEAEANMKIYGAAEE